MELILEFIFELIFEGIIEGSKNKRMPMPIRIICGILLILFHIVIIGGIIFLAVNLFMKKEYLMGVFTGIIAIAFLSAIILYVKKQYMKKKRVV